MDRINYIIYACIIFVEDWRETNNDNSDFSQDYTDHDFSTPEVFNSVHPILFVYLKNIINY